MSNTLQDSKDILDDMYNAMKDIDTLLGSMGGSMSSIM